MSEIPETHCTFNVDTVNTLFVCLMRQCAYGGEASHWGGGGEPVPGSGPEHEARHNVVESQGRDREDEDRKHLHHQPDPCA